MKSNIWLDFPQKDSILEFNTKQYKDEKLPLNQCLIVQNQAQAPCMGWKGGLTMIENSIREQRVGLKN